MKTYILSALVLAALAAPTMALEPIPGSITFPTQPRTKLVKAPIGSVVNHSFTDGFGRRVKETYIITADRSLKLVHRTTKQH
ncbi:hypothetical protein FVA81_00460 (plasmid) [Rhizobium sp. WL3]|uniref:hypothetical protein n=1 Tax=Rhizobium sp. WL3 TaxID=2603277 RepID=UPI0011C1DB5D|nr:hypothetical protein [Rhizobium sp. WL3]QEE43165.1 hypothetical protein FVA81_00460 [Rhizobium sp. WL3]